MTVTAIDLHWVQQPGSVPRSIVRPATIEEATRALAENPELRPVAGGTDLLLDLARDRQGGSVDLLDMTTIEGFNDLRFDSEGVFIGAGVTHADILASPDARELVLPLAQACLEIGSPQLRNRATVVGNLVTASPANDTISALLALDASVVAVKSDGDEIERRQIPLADFYDGFRSTVLEPNELIESIKVPASVGSRRGVWVKAGLRKAQAISVVHAVIVLEFAGDQTVTSARIALGSVGPTVELSVAAAEGLVGSSLGPATIAAAAQAAADSVTPIDDGRATAEYRRDSIITVVSRALTAIAKNEESDRWPDRVPLLSTRDVTSRFGAGAGNESARSVVAGSEIAVSVNGANHTAEVVGAGTLLDWLRETAGTGTKEGCAEGECGACTVQMDGDAVMSCLVPALQADGASVTTTEGLADVDSPSGMQQSFVDRFAVQCGYCIPGFVVAAQTLAEEVGSVPTREEIELALSGNLCRCTGYYNIIDAVTAAIASELS